MTSRTIKIFECESSSSTLQASWHFDHIPFHTQFFCIRSILTHCMIRIWLICGFWEVDEVVPITCFIIKPLGVTSTFAYIAMLCYVDWVSVSMIDVRLLINGLLKVATLIHIWVDWGTWVTSDCLFYFFGNPGVTVWFSYGPPPRLKGIMRFFKLETSVCSHKPLWALA